MAWSNSLLEYNKNALTFRDWSHRCPNPQAKAAKDGYAPLFEPVDMILNLELLGESGEYITRSEAFETGYLTYGNANPDSSDFNSLADFICNGDDIEVKLPWQLLNFSQADFLSHMYQSLEHFAHK